MELLDGWRELGLRSRTVYIDLWTLRADIQSRRHMGSLACFFFFAYTGVSCLRTSLGVFMHLRDLLLHAAMNMQGIGVPFGECENNGGQKTTRVLYRGRDGLIVKRSLYVCIYVCPCLRRRKNANLAIVILPISRGAQHSCSFLTVKPWILGPPHSFLGRNGVCTSAFLLV